MAPQPPLDKSSSSSEKSTTRASKKKLTKRHKLRIWLESPKIELGTVVFVLFYMLIIFIDIAVPDFLSIFMDSTFQCNESLKTTWQQAFWCIDMGFLSLFMIELAVRFYAFGLLYFKDPFNTIDSLIILGSFSMAIVVFDTVFNETGSKSAAQSTSQLTKMIRIVRVFRLVTAMTKFQKNRAATDVQRKKAKYRKAGSYVERVIDILQKLRKTSPFMESNEDRENLNFIMDIIVSDQLYAVNLQAAGEGGVSNDMKNFLQQSGVETNTRKKGGKEGEGDKKDGDAANGGHAEGEEDAAKKDRAERRKQRMSTTRLADGDELSWVDRLIDTDPVASHLQNAHKWDFSIFELEEKSGGHPIVAMVLHFVRQLDLDEQLPINMPFLMKYLTELEMGYKSSKEVPFHNMSHGADCTHGTTYFLLQPQMRQHLTTLDLYCIILGAAMHDFEHPGVSNAFLVNSRHDTAILYNDSSVLESFHVSRAWRLMLIKGQDPFDGFSKEQYTEARQTLVSCILGTDMKFHFDHLTKFKTRAQAGAFQNPDRKDVRLLLTMCMHAADVSNPAKPWHLSKEWTSRVMDEFFRQGDAEAEGGLPISPFMDRAKTNIGTCQVGFINILIKPFFHEWCQFLGDQAMTEVFANVESNVATWADQGEEVLGDRLAIIKAAPLKT